MWEVALWERFRDAVHLPMEHPIRKALRWCGLLREQRSVASCLKQAQIIVTNLGVSHDRLSRRELLLLDDLWFEGLPTAEMLVEAAVEDGYLDEEEAVEILADKSSVYGDIRHVIAERLMAQDIEVEDWWQTRRFAD